MAEEERREKDRRISRRDFVVGAGAGTASLLAGGLIGCAEGPPPEEVLPRAEGHIMQVEMDESACAGCGTCEVVCALVHDGAAGPSLRRIWLDRDGVGLTYQVLTCQQCDYPACYDSCQVEGAMGIDSETGARYIDTTRCTGCGDCIDACPADPPRINFDPVREVALKCDLCKDRPNGPACVEFCQTKALKLVPRKEKEAVTWPIYTDGRVKSHA
jgi:Fe-S-cluster-containing hydrogenase component 2